MSAATQVALGGALVFGTGVLIGNRKKWRRSKRGRGGSKTCVSPASNSNSFPHSSTGQPTRNFSLLDPNAVGCVRTTQVPHLGQVTHEHAMRSAIGQLYCAINERPSSTLVLSLSLLAGRIFRLRVHFGWGTSSRLPNLRHPGPRHGVAVGCDYGRSNGCRPEHVLACAFDGKSPSRLHRTVRTSPRPIPACDRCVTSRSKTPLAAKRSSARKTPWPRYRPVQPAPSPFLEVIEPLLSVPRAAKILGISQCTLRNWIQRKKTRGSKSGAA